MGVHNKLPAVAAAFILLTLGACTSGFPAQVSRFQAMPAPAGQSFFVEPANPARQGGLEFRRYAGLVRRQLVERGYGEAVSPQEATFVVTLDYGVDGGQTRITPRPAAGLWGYRPDEGRYANFRQGYPFHYGWNDGFDSQIVYTSFVDVGIRRRADRRSLFEGSAKARSRTDDLQALVPNLVVALFTGFPGNSGETVRITLPAAFRR
jgi:hypothetical protein